jgi:hypothetical protein
LCIHRHESVDWHRVTDWLGNPSPYRGGMQIAVGTWSEFAFTSFPHDPAAATPHQQLLVSYAIWRANGRRFGGRQWYYSAERCGVH